MFCAVLLALVGSVLTGPIDFEANLKHHIDLGRLQKDLASLEERLTNTPEVESEISLLKAAYEATIVENPTPVNGSTFEDQDINGINEKAGEEKDLFEGDILLTSEQLSIIENPLSSNRSRRQSLSDAGFSWGTVKPVIPYSYSAGYPMDRRPTIEAAMKFWEDNTCVRFKPSTTEYRVEIQDSAGCSSYIGKLNDYTGTQELNLGKYCMRIGTVCHELKHTFGFFHVQSRYDRNRYVYIDFNNIKSGEKHNFDIEPADKTWLRGIPYEFGSNMHYYHKDFAKNSKKPVIYAKPAYKVYQEGMLGRLPTFYDILGVNKHFNCFANCKNSITCANGGVQDVNNCNKCLCPLGWAGDKCNQRPAGTKTILATTTLKKMTSQFNQGTMGLHYKTQYYLFRAPAGMKVQITPKVLVTRWSNACNRMGVEIKFQKDSRPSGLQVCDSRVKQPTITSETNEMIVQAYTLGEKSVIELQYKAVN